MLFVESQFGFHRIVEQLAQLFCRLLFCIEQQLLDAAALEASQRGVQVVLVRFQLVVGGRMLNVKQMLTVPGSDRFAYLLGQLFDAF